MVDGGSQDINGLARLPAPGVTGACELAVRHVRDTEADVSVRVHVWRPAHWTVRDPVLMVLHGYRRNADAYRDVWAEHAERHRILIAAPEFDRGQFPGPREYEVGNMRTPDRRAFLPSGDWSFGVVETAFDAVCAWSGAEADRYYLYGHSAGGQFVHRMVLFRPDARIGRAVAANAGAYTVPREEARYPFGLVGCRLSDGALADAFAVPLVVLVGEDDTDPDAAMLLKSPEAMVQGPHRFARGRYFFEAGMDMARAIPAPCAWTLETAPGVGHDNRGMAAKAADILFGHR